MKLGNMIKALEIIKKYADEGAYFSAEHDTIYFPPDNAGEKISKEDLKILEKLGISLDEESDTLYSFT